MKKTTYVILTIIGIVAYNAFLIKRDREMFDAYYNKQTSVPVEVVAHIA